VCNWDQDFLWDAGFAAGNPVWVYAVNPDDMPANAAGGF
jgi:hypothetical protein